MNKVRAGFTIIELMVVIVISAILMMMAVPSYQGFIKRNNVQNLQSRIAAAVVTARSEAASRNAVVTLCASIDGERCGGTWSDGWMVFLDDGEGVAGVAKNADREGDEQLILSFSNVGNYSVVMTDEKDGSVLPAFSFNSQGFSLDESRALVTVCEPDGDVQYARGLIIERSGRTMTTRDLSGDDGIHESRFDDGYGNVTVNDLSC
ncbi:MAG TPA: GspH/FimT family pseudopilin [Marinagarivorans sp.]